jgi:hypothetical protein
MKSRSPFLEPKATKKTTQNQQQQFISDETRRIILRASSITTRHDKIHMAFGLTQIRRQ